MKPPPTQFLRLYRKALLAKLSPKTSFDPQWLAELAKRAIAGHMSPGEAATLHEKLLITELLPKLTPAKRSSLIRGAGNFHALFLAAMGAADGEKPDTARNRKAIGSLSTRNVFLALENTSLAHDVNRLKKVESELRESERANLAALADSEIVREQMRGLSRQIINIQENERKRISRELHDVIAQALLGVNVRLSCLKTEAGINTKDLGRNIALTQKMVTKSANIVHQFARELRPAVIDDLGLTPALQCYIDNFAERTGIITNFSVFSGVEKLNAAKRIVLYRVTQEALTNVAQHAKAKSVDVVLRSEGSKIRLDVTDNGKSFNVREMLTSKGKNRIGLLGMRERVEMVGGSFHIESAPNKGTTITALIPCKDRHSTKQRSKEGLSM